MSPDERRVVKFNGHRQVKTKLQLAKREKRGREEKTSDWERESGKDKDTHRHTFIASSWWHYNLPGLEQHFPRTKTQDWRVLGDEFRMNFHVKF